MTNIKELELYQKELIKVLDIKLDDLVFLIKEKASEAMNSKDEKDHEFFIYSDKLTKLALVLGKAREEIRALTGQIAD